MKWLAIATLWAGLLAGAHAADQAGSGQDDAATARQVLVLIHRLPEHFRADNAYAGTYGPGFGKSARQRLAAQLAHDYGLELTDDWPIQTLGMDCFVMRVPDRASVESVTAALSADKRVEWAQPMHVYEGKGRSLYATQPAAQDWHLDDLHELATGRDVRVAVIDSGVDRHHPDLAGQVAAETNFIDTETTPPEAHGTAVAGIIASRSDTRAGIVGVAPQARLLAIRACRQRPGGGAACNSLSLAKALDYAINQNAHIINLSLSGPYDPLLDRLLNVALAHRIAVVAAVDAAQADGGFPASKSGVFPVTDEPRGAIPAQVFRAPGRDVPTTGTADDWVFVSGSSYAAAHVTGLLALIQQLRPNLSIQPGNALVRSELGHIDACASLLQWADHRQGTCAAIETAKAGKH